MAARTKDKEPAPVASTARPLIAVNTDLVTPKNGIPFAKLNVGYIDAIVAAGGLPLLLPPLRKDNLADIDALLDQCAGIVLTGGADMDPRRNGQPLTAVVSPMPARREDADRHLLARIFERRRRCSGSASGCSSSTCSPAAPCTCTCRPTTRRRCRTSTRPGPRTGTWC
jgi:putative glutamine amidotransferase